MRATGRKKDVAVREKILGKPAIEKMSATDEKRMKKGTNAIKGKKIVVMIAKKIGSEKKASGMKAITDVIVALRRIEIKAKGIARRILKNASKIVKTVTKEKMILSNQIAKKNLEREESAVMRERKHAPLAMWKIKVKNGSLKEEVGLEVVTVMIKMAKETDAIIVNPVENEEKEGIEIEAAIEKKKERGTVVASGIGIVETKMMIEKVETRIEKKETVTAGRIRIAGIKRISTEVVEINLVVGAGNGAAEIEMAMTMVEIATVRKGTMKKEDVMIGNVRAGGMITEIMDLETNIHLVMGHHQVGILVMVQDTMTDLTEGNSLRRKIYFLHDIS